MQCDECEHWIITRETHYEDGSVVVNKRAPVGKGTCDILNVDTEADFGCTKFSASGIHSVIFYKAGAPWQHHVMVPCPDCAGAGSNNSTACMRCTGTAKVRRYDDGHVGEERTRQHPKEKEAIASGNPMPPINPELDGTKLLDLSYREKDRDMGSETL